MFLNNIFVVVLEVSIIILAAYQFSFSSTETVSPIFVHNHSQKNDAGIGVTKLCANFIRTINHGIVGNEEEINVSGPVFGWVSADERLRNGGHLKCSALFVSNRDLVVDAGCLRTLVNRLSFESNIRHNQSDSNEMNAQAIDEDKFDYRFRVEVPDLSATAQFSDGKLQSITEEGLLHVAPDEIRMAGIDGVPLITLPEPLHTAPPCIFPMVITRPSNISHLSLNAFACWQMQQDNTQLDNGIDTSKINENDQALDFHMAHHLPKNSRNSWKIQNSREKGPRVHCRRVQMGAHRTRISGNESEPFELKMDKNETRDFNITWPFLFAAGKQQHSRSATTATPIVGLYGILYPVNPSSNTSSETNNSENRTATNNNKQAFSMSHFDDASCQTINEHTNGRINCVEEKVIGHEDRNNNNTSSNSTPKQRHARSEQTLDNKIALYSKENGYDNDDGTFTEPADAASGLIPIIFLLLIIVLGAILIVYVLKKRQQRAFYDAI